MTKNKSQFNQAISNKLIKKAQKGDMASHELLYRSFSDAVYHLALSITNNIQVAEDILQNTFINVLNKISNYSFKAPFGMWLRKITVNQTLMYIRADKNNDKKKLALTDNIIDFKTVLNDNNAINREVEQSDMQLDLKYLLSQLPLQTRTVLWLKEVEGYTHCEIANMMGKTESYSKSLLARTYEILQNRNPQNSRNDMTNLEQN